MESQGPRQPGAGGWGWAALGWLAGCALQLRQPALWSPGAYLVLIAAGALLAVPTARRRAWLLLPAVAALAFGSVGLRAGARLAESLPKALEGRDLELVGVVAQMPRIGPDAVRFVFEVESARAGGETVSVPALVSLGWYGGFDMDSWLDGPARELKAGQRWRLVARLKQPHGSMNPNGFDLELWLFEQGLRAGGYVRSNARAPAQLLAEGVAHPFERLRQRVRDGIVARVPDATAAGVLAALAVGDQGAIDREDWDLFRVTGVAHLMSISGLHVTMFAWLAGALVARLWRTQPRLMLALPAPAAARWGGLAAAAAYSLVAGWGVPAQRTVWMLGCVTLLRGSGRRWPLLAVLLAAAVVVTAIDPWAMLQPGFWLSFAAVAMLVSSEPATGAAPPAAGRFARLRAAVAGGLRTQAVASAGLAPLSMVFFQQVSIAGLVANLFAIPVVTLLITPLALLGVLLPPLWTLDAMLVQGLMAALRALAAWPMAVWTAAAAPSWAVAAGLLGGVVLLLPWPWRRRLLGLPLMLPLLAPAVERPPEGRFEAVAADIGQGTAVLVRTANHLLVYDTGPQYSPEADAGQRVLLPLLRTRGETRVDLLMLSHRDSDHVGGAASLLAAAPVAALSSSLEPQHPLRARPVSHQRCLAGQAWDWDGVHFEVLHPTEADYATATKPNALSCVLRIAGRETSLLLTGDIEAPQEAALLARGAPVASDVLLVPHHGSRTSSTPAFLDAVAPRTAVVQAAYRSRFGHPAPDVVARYEERGIEVVRSDRCGAWTLPAAAPAVCERIAARRYWHHDIAGPPR
ncbi:MAG: DNA internalization-related competence protein ComEC/Rec2 [Rubrivivax sp.]